MDVQEETAWTSVEWESQQMCFSIPSDWAAIEVREAAMAALSPAVDDEHYRSNVTISEYPLDVVGDLAAFGDKHLRDLERLLTDFRLLEVSDAQLGRFPGVRITASFRQGAYDLTLDEWVALTDTTMVTASAVASNFDYPGEVAVFERIVESVHDA